MAKLETFSWFPLNGPTADINFRTTSVQYGDGYEQAAGEGINTESQSWPLTFTGFNEEILPILAFLRAHAGVRAFKWTNPLGELGLYRAKEIKPTILDFERMSITVTFSSAYRAEPT